MPEPANAVARMAPPPNTTPAGGKEFVDGLVIAAAFLTSVPLGVATAFVVIAHEVPQEIGDFAILLESADGGADAAVGAEGCRQSMP